MMISMGKRQSKGDHTLFVKRSDLGVTILLVYINDIILTGDDEKEKRYVEKCLAKEFEFGKAEVLSRNKNCTIQIRNLHLSIEVC